MPTPRADLGYPCPQCGSLKTVVVDSRRVKTSRRRRRRRCLKKSCQHRWTTYELDEADLASMELAQKTLLWLQEQLRRYDTLAKKERGDEREPD